MAKKTVYLDYKKEKQWEVFSLKLFHEFFIFFGIALILYTLYLIYVQDFYRALFNLTIAVVSIFYAFYNYQIFAKKDIKLYNVMDVWDPYFRPKVEQTILMLLAIGVISVFLFTTIIGVLVIIVSAILAYYACKYGQAGS